MIKADDISGMGPEILQYSDGIFINGGVTTGMAKLTDKQLETLRKMLDRERMLMFKRSRPSAGEILQRGKAAPEEGEPRTVVVKRFPPKEATKPRVIRVARKPEEEIPVRKIRVARESAGPSEGGTPG